MGLLDNFRVIEVTKATEPSYVIIEDNKMRFTKSSAVELGFPPYVRVLMDDEGQRIAIQVAREMRAMLSSSQQIRRIRLRLSCITTW